MSTSRDATRTGRLVNAGVWACAAIVMVSSARNGAVSFAALGEDPRAGFALGVAVDVALAVALVGDRALHVAGWTSAWGRALRVSTCLMSGGLNCAVPAWQGHYGIAVFHAFLPVLLVLLTEYAQDRTLLFQAADDAARQAQRDEADASARAEAEQRQLEVDARRQQAVEETRLARERLVAVVAVQGATLAVLSRPRRPAQRRTAVQRPAHRPRPAARSHERDKDSVVAWAVTELAEGRDAGWRRIRSERGLSEHHAKQAARLARARHEQTPHLAALERTA